MIPVDLFQFRMAIDILSSEHSNDNNFVRAPDTSTAM